MNQQQERKTGTFEEATFFALAVMHGQLYGTGEHMVHRDLPQEGCSTCAALITMREHVTAQGAPEFTDADIAQMADIMLIEQEFALEQARTIIDSATYPAAYSDGCWNNTEVESLRDRENIAKAIKYLQHCKLLEVHPTKPEFVRIKETP